MAYENDQSDIPLPSGSERKVESVSLLPKYFRTDTNKKFLNSTIDQMIKPGVVEKVNAFAGRRYAKATRFDDSYLKDVSADRENYQLEPAVLYKDELNNVEFFKDYNDYISQIKNFNGSVSNHSTLNRQEYYAWNPHINWDKVSNFQEYYWLPYGPSVVTVTGQSRDIVSTYTVTLSEDLGSVSYVFSPDGLTKSPTLKLYRGQTYKFEINTPGYPFAIAIFRTFLDNDPSLGTDITNESTLYRKGVVATSDYVENGVIEFTVPDDAPDVLYYISQNNVDVSGQFAIFEISENSQIDVDLEIVGKKNYRTSNGIELSNGMKIKFQGIVTPEKYSVGNWYVEGVGNEIVLISEQDLEIPAIFTQTVATPFDSESGFDTLPFEDAVSYPGVKDYITISRASADRNPWSRYNRWFHKEVIETSARVNGLQLNLDQNARATRPIIEFDPGLKLFNHGYRNKTNVDLVDAITEDVFSIVEGSLGYNIDTVDLADGMRVLFIADTDITVRGKIYQVNFIIHNGVRQVSLVETNDSVPLDGETVLVLNGNRYKGKMFHYTSDGWQLAQDKLGVNQPPLFDLFDKDENSFSDEIVYPSSNFAGNKIFSYRVGAGIPDSELGFAISYRNISNIGDIVFDFNLLTETFNYQNSLQETISKNTDLGFLRKYNAKTQNFVYVNAWKKAFEESRQAVIRQFVANGDDSYPVDVFNNSATLSDLEVKVLVNNKKQKLNVDYRLENSRNIANIVFNKKLNEGDIVLLKCYSSADKNQNGFYEIPINLERNSLNENVSTFTLGEVNDHVNSIVENNPNFDGEFPGTGNLRDIGSSTEYGSKFVQHTGPINLALYHITDKNANIIKAIRFAKKEYSKFKRQFLREAEQSGFDGTVKEHVDYILEKVNKDKVVNQPFYFTDMLGYSNDIKTVHSVVSPITRFFALATPFDLTKLSIQAVNVYLNDVQLIHGRDYVFEEGFVKVLTALDDGDKIVVHEYDSTNGSFIPPTPTKLGLYPAYEPQIILDDTYVEPRTMIQGHDGSLMLAFDDYRDDLVIELERRIYNNIKNRYNSDILDIYDFVGGKYRNTGISTNKINAAMLTDFSQWLENAGSPDFTSIDFWDKDNSFTYNYGSMSDRAQLPISGFWRKIYKDYYDTDRPHSHPWEMIGFTVKPVWWESVYGPAPYTKNNTILWKDLSEGVIREPGKNLIRDNRFVRPDLLNYIPVDEEGNLISPLSSGVAQNFVLTETNKPFNFGDHAPVETAWRRSSDYPFALLTSWVLNQPAKVIGLGFDLSKIEKDLTGAKVYAPSGKRIAQSDLEFPCVCIVEELKISSGLVNYVANFAANFRITNQVSPTYLNYQTQLTNLTNQLALKIGGFTDKDKFKLLLDSRTPANKGNIFVPDENYQIFLNTSSAIDVAVFSGIVIERKESGFIISGYDKENPIFVYNKPIARQNDTAIRVGGISERFVEWAPNNEYPIGTIVEYQNQYYRTKISHRSEATFDANKFSRLAELPTVGGATALIRKEFEAEETVIAYGSNMPTIQDVVNFLCGYEHNLKKKGFVFEHFNTQTNSLEDMRLCIKEFLFWTTQNWDIGSIISISPVANRVTFRRNNFTVDDIFDNFYDYNLLTSDGKKFNREFSNISRSTENEFGVKPVGTSNGIYLVKLPLVQTEHVVLIDNTTVFNDVIFDQVPGYRQERIKVVGYRTDNWTGGLNIPGFFYDTAKVRLWQPWTDYIVGDLVKYKEFYYSANIKHTSNEFFDANHWNILSEKPESKLVPNWDYKTNQFGDFYDLDSDNFDLEQQRLAQHLIGYQKRQYLANIIPDEVSQYKFYQGFIQDKGTLNSLTKLFDALSTSNRDSLEFYEEWAIRLGQYGATSSIDEIEYVLDESKFRIEPQIIELNDVVTTNRLDLVYEITKAETLLKPEDYDHKPFPTFDEYRIFAKDSGFVKEQDVDLVVINKAAILELDINIMQAGQYVWVLDHDNSWTVLRLVVDEARVVNYSFYDGGFSLIFDRDVNFRKGDILGIGSDLFNLGGFYQIDRVSKNIASFKTNKSLTIFENFNDSSVYSVTRFVERRFGNIDDVNNNFFKLKQFENEKVWIDPSAEFGWKHYVNNNTFKFDQQIENPTEEFTFFGTAFDVNNSNTLMAIGAPEENDGVVRLYTRSSEKNQWKLSRRLSSIEIGSKYGQSVAISGDSKHVAIGSPSFAGGQGEVYIYTKDARGYFIQSIRLQGFATGTNFGSKILFTKDKDTTRLFVSAPTEPANIYVYDYIEETGWSQTPSSVISGLNYNTTYQNVEQFDIDSKGNILAISVVINDDDSTAGSKVLVYRYDAGTWSVSQEISSNDPEQDFGFTLAVSDNGTKIAVGAPKNDDKGTNNGCVYIYKQISGVFGLFQTLYSPFTDFNEMFGIGIDFSQDKLIVSSKNGDLLEKSILDDGTTIFDKGTTRFVDKTKDTGKIYLYQELNDLFVFAEDVSKTDFKDITIFPEKVKFKNLSSVRVNNNHVYVARPEYDSKTIETVLDCRAEIGTSSWVIVDQQTPVVDTTKIKKCFLYDRDKNKILVDLDIFDPRQGRIPGPAEQEISFKTFYDPAVYTFTEAENKAIVVDPNNAWTFENVGKLWWKLDTSSWLNAYQGSSIYRSFAWDQLVFNAKVEICEWVESDISPAEWKRLSGTVTGSTSGISGTPLYDNAYSIRRVFDTVSNSFTQKYYFWVVNKQSLPQIDGRRRTAAEVAQFIQDPSQAGYRYISILDNNKFSLHNVRSLIEGTNIVIHFTIENAENQNNIHTEYQLLTEGLALSRPNVQVEEKWIDSLVGYDKNRNAVPNNRLPVRQRYGILNSPRQGMFVNKIEAVKQLVERVNGILIKNQIVDNFDLSLLFAKDEIPVFESGLYDLSIDNRSQLRFVSTAKVEQAVLEPEIVDGKIVRVNIINSGRGYKIAPEIQIETQTGTGAILKAKIDNLGKIVSVDINRSGRKYSENDKLLVRKYSVLIVSDNLAENRWSIVEWNSANQEWNLTASESFDTTQYWNYADWFANGVTDLSIVDFNIDQSYELFGLNDQIGDVVKINNVGNQGWLLLRKVDDQLVEDYSVNYETIGRQNGTIQLSDKLYNYATISGFDSNIYDNAGYDKEPVIELRNILTALKDSIFINELGVEWNKLFFASVRYAFTEQKYLDWIFKTSFVRAKHNLGELTQKITFQNDNLESYEEYVKEVKPFKTKIREYISDYSANDNTQTLTTDFDLPPSYDPVIKVIETSEATFTGTEIANIKGRYFEYPFKNWVDNVGFDLVKIEMVDQGSRYLETPIVTVVSDNLVEAKAFLSQGRVANIEIVRAEGKFLSKPEIIIEGTFAEGGSPAKAIAVLGNSLVRTPSITIKFDRYATTEFEQDLNVVEEFEGTGGKLVFDLKWPAETKKNSYKIYINDQLQLSDDIIVNNKEDNSLSYTRKKGFVQFAVAPVTGDVIRVEYTKSIEILSAVDRINYYYDPLSGMPGKDYAQLMTGMEYSGVSVTGVGFGTDQGWDVVGWESSSWDTFDNTFDDQIFLSDESTRIYQTSKPLENGVEYNVYLEYELAPGETTPVSVRIDDPDFDGGTPSNSNAQMNTIVGDGVVSQIELPVTVNLEGVAKVIVRKSTSDGSFSAPDISFDTFLTGGSFSNSQLVGALGVEAGEIIVDGDGFVTPTTSAGPEELVPGQLADTLDIQVYHRKSDGSAIIGVVNYNIEPDVTEYALSTLPLSADSIIVKVDNVIVPGTAYTVDYINGLLTIVDESVLSGSMLTAMTLSTNGIGILETDEVVITDQTSIITKILWVEPISAFVSANGIVLKDGVDYLLEQSTDLDEISNRVKITFLNNSVTENSFVQYSIYEGSLQNYSQILIDNTFVANGVNNYHVFDGVNNPIPFNKQIPSFNILVKVDDKILRPGFNSRFVAGEPREYVIDTWQFADISGIDVSEVFVFADGVELSQDDFTFDKSFSTLRFLRNNVAPEDTVVEVFIITNADYYFADTNIKFSSSVSQSISAGDTITLKGIDLTEYTLEVLEVNDNQIKVKTFVLELKQKLSIISDYMLNDTVPVTVETVTFNVSENLTFRTPPANGATVEIYQFSNHDVYDFSRSSYDIISSSTVNIGTPDYYKRNLLRSGRIKLQNPSFDAKYVWVIKNGLMLTPHVDYILEDRTTVKLTSVPAEQDNFDVIQINNLPVTPKFGYRIFKDIFNRTHYKRLNQENSYTLAKDLNFYDIKIDLVDATGIQMPDKTKNMPGIIFIDRERIEFFEVVGNSLTQLRRGTLGTGIKNVHPAGTTVYGQGLEETVAYSDQLIVSRFDIDRNENEIELDFNLQQLLTDYIAQSARDVVNVKSEDFFEVTVAGRKLRKTNLAVFANTDLDSTSGDITVEPEFAVNQNKLIIDPLLLPENAKVRVEVKRKLGKTWYSDDVSMAFADNAITRFLRDATIELPK